MKSASYFGAGQGGRAGRYWAIATKRLTPYGGKRAAESCCELTNHHTRENPDVGPIWVHSEIGVVIGDAYPDNFVVLEDNSVMPIDLPMAIYSGD